MKRLVDYSDSDSDDDNPTTSKKQKPRAAVASGQGQPKTSSPPPLPAAFHDLYATNVRVSNADDPSLHGGRKRQTPHVEGNWPSHIYLEWHPTREQTTLLERVISAASLNTPETHTLLESALGASLPLHISLSRTLQLQFSDRDTFPSALDSAIRSAGVKPFSLSFADVAWFANFERNRWFLSLACRKPSRNELSRLLEASNKTCLERQLPLLYCKADQNALPDEAEAEAQTDSGIDSSDAPFHVSLAYTLKAPAEVGKPLLAKNEKEHAELQSKLLSMAVVFDTVKIKIGNKITSLELGKRGFEDRKSKGGGLLD